MLFVDYYLYLYNLEESERIKQVLIIVAILISLLVIDAIIQYLKSKYLHKIKNERIREFIRKI